MTQEKNIKYVDIFISRTLKEYLKLCNRSDYEVFDVLDLIELLTDFLGIKLK